MKISMECSEELELSLYFSYQVGSRGTETEQKSVKEDNLQISNQHVHKVTVLFLDPKEKLNVQILFFSRAAVLYYFSLLSPHFQEPE